MRLDLRQSIKLKTKNLQRVVADPGGIYVGDSLLKVFALEPDDFRVRWDIKARGFDPVAAGDVVVLFSDSEGVLSGVDARTGETRWTLSPEEHPLECSPWRGGLLRLTTGEHDRALLSLDPATGAIVEEIVLGSWAQVLDDWHALLVIDEHTGRCVDLRDGNVVWERPVFDLPRDAAAVPPGAKVHPMVGFHPPGTVVIQVGTGLAAVQLGSGDTLWATSLPTEPTAFMTVDLGCVVTTTPHEMIAFDAGDGRVRWIRARRPVPEGYLAQPFVPPRHAWQGMLLSLEQDGLYLIDPESGKDVASAAGLTFVDVATIGESLVAVREDGRVNVFRLDRSPVRAKTSKATRGRTVVRARGGTLTFEEIARVELPGLRSPSRVVPTAEAVFVSDAAHGVVKVARDGWRVDWRKPSGSFEITWASGGVAIARLAAQGRVVALRDSDGERVWETESTQGQAWVLDEGRLLTVPPGSGNVRVVEIRTGRVLRALERRLARVLGTAGGLVAVVADDGSAAERLLPGTSGPFAVIDVEDGRTIWSRQLEPALKEMARHDDRLNLQVTGIDAEWLVLWHWSPPSYGSDLWGVSMVTGAVAWHVRLEGHGRAAFDGSHVWSPIEKPGFECVEVRTGTRIRREAPTFVVLRHVGGYGRYQVSVATRKVDFYHAQQETQRLHLEHDARLVAGTSPDLFLAEPERLRVLRELPLD